ncbi:MAG TPA: hypothetical protein VLD67_01700, partial [Vicinamibacterales bacterium]|nr:hypothetical protein [Vicinamibacterales bacterium]
MTIAPRRCRVWLLILLLFCTAAAVQAAGEYRTLEVESLRITIDSEWAVRAAPGYVPVRFDITNLAEARVIEILGQSSRFFRMSGAARQSGLVVRRALRLARGDRVRLTIPVPVYSDNESIRLEIREDGRTLERFNYYGFESRSLPADASALIVAHPGSEFGRMAAGWPRTMAHGPRRVVIPPGAMSAPGRVVVGSGAGGPTRPLDFLLAPERLPTSWLGFTSLRAVVIGPGEWQLLDEPQRSALLTWTACGGDLFFVDGSPGKLLPAWQQSSVPEGAVRAYFFGRVHTPTSASIASAGLSDVLAKAEALQDANWALPANRASDWGVIAGRGYRLPIPGVGGVPARAYLAILIVFSLLIGPANYWFLWRKRQLVLLVLTAPAISLIFIGLLAGYVVAGEGVGVRGRTVTFTMLDQVRKQAATRASVSLYAAGMAPAGGLRFGRDEAVFTIGPDGTGSRESQTLDLTEAQRFAAGVIQARSPTNLETIGFRPARERLGFDREAGKVNVVNGLGVTIRALVYRAGDALHHLPGPLLPGHRGTLAPGGQRGADLVPAGLPLSSRFEHLFDHQPDGSYLAVLERSPFWNPGVTEVDERDSFHVVIGWA